MYRYQKKQAGFFKKEYISYTINIKPMNWEVNRRYNDFNWLRTSLLQLFPGIIIPPIAKKKSNNL